VLIIKGLKTNFRRWRRRRRRKLVGGPIYERTGVATLNKIILSV
jgi:hypothetical protein